MPVKVRRRRGRYVVADRSGRVPKGRTHKTKAKAAAQARAINASLRRRGRIGPRRRRRG